MSQADWSLSYEINPIILTGGIATNLPGGQLSIGDLTGANDEALGDPPGIRFKVMPQGTLLENEAATYTFANQATAANAIVFKGLRISLLMIAPAQTPGGYDGKLQIFSNLIQPLTQHIGMGGLFTVATPAMVYDSSLLLSIRDVTGPDEKQPQVQYQWDFYQPLVTLAQATAAMNNLYSKMANGTQIVGDPPAQGGVDNTQGNAQSGIGAYLIPNTSALVGSSVGSGG